MRNLVLGLLFLVLLAGVSGCQTVKRSSEGFGIGRGIGGFARGLTEDVKNVWSAIEKADAWVEENYW
ncbi:MAG: hypothetical protein KAS05_02950 [Candidatus Omnitrophica bacterium]|nr:hypothetical protein [Candidatus Omnitrophota bacterium]